ncbi:hypothetical protein SEA_PETERSON_52 [Mycobacterium phage Peterson]|nr:hypothetical protein SEA_PETERSON_52 [Mycobacterium phage Peterson]
MTRDDEAYQQMLADGVIKEARITLEIGDEKLMSIATYGPDFESSPRFKPSASSNLLHAMFTGLVELGYLDRDWAPALTRPID